MYFLLSGEGPADLAYLEETNSSDDSHGFDDLCVYMGNRLCFGPMGVLLQKLVEPFLEWNPLRLLTSRVGFFGARSVKPSPHEVPQERKERHSLTGEEARKRNTLFFSECSYPWDDRAEKKQRGQRACDRGAVPR